MHALIAGTLHRSPEQRTAKSGRLYVVARLRAKMGAETAWASVTAFGDAQQAALLRLKEGDAVSVQGELKVGTYVDKHGAAQPSIELIANEVLALRQPKKPRTDAAPSPSPESFEDAIPF